MEILGHIQNGVVVLDPGTTLPEGTRVSVSPVPPPLSKPEIVLLPGQLPVVRGGVPGTWNLTNERLYEILYEEEDAYTRSLFLGLPDPRDSETKS